MRHRSDSPRSPRSLNKNAGGFTLRPSHCLFAAVAFVGVGSLFLLLFVLHSAPLPASDEALGDANTEPTVAHPVGGRLRAAAAAAVAAAGSAATVNFQGDPTARAAAERAEANAAAALKAVQAGFTALDARLSATGLSGAGGMWSAPGLLGVGGFGAAVQAPPQADVASQVAALSSQVTVLTSLLAQGQRGAQQQWSAQSPQTPPPETYNPWAAPTPPPAPTPEDVKHLKEQVDGMTKSLKRLARLTDDRVSNLQAALHKSLPDEGDSGGAPPPDTGGHACRSPPCSRDMESCKLNDNCCSDRMFEMLVDFTGFLDRNNITYAIVEGTLLGAVRDKDIIPYTSDLDIFIPREGWERAKEISQEWNHGKSYYLLQDPEEQHCARLCAVWRGLPVNRAAFNKHFDWDTDSVGAEVQYYMDIYDEGMPFADKLKHLIYPISNATIRNLTFKAPKEQELWVEARYGESWRIPDHQSHGGSTPAKYPTVDEAKAWSENMMLLRKARTDAVLGHRLLERATVDHSSGKIVLGSLDHQGPPGAPPKKIALEDFAIGPDGQVSSGTLVVLPPENPDVEGQVTQYKAYWAMEQLQGWDLSLKHLGTGELMTIPRCAGAGIDPFKACAERGIALRVNLPSNPSLPKGATHIAVVSSNEDGDSSDTGVDIVSGDVDSEAVGFSRRVQLGVLGGMGPEFSSVASCVNGTVAPLLRSGVDAIVDRMVRKTMRDMTKALRMTAAWLRPIEAVLTECNDTHAAELKTMLNKTLVHLEIGEVTYQPGVALAIDQTSLFMGVNQAIGQLRKGKPAAFGYAVGEMLKPLANQPFPSPSPSPPVTPS